MKETTLLKIALVCSLSGLAVLYFASSKMELKDYKPKPSALSKNNNNGDDVRLKGIVTGINSKGKVIFIEVSQQSPVNIVVFTGGEGVKLSKGDNIEVTGRVQEYNGRDEIIAEKIRVMR